MNKCLYQCIFFQLHLVADGCPLGGCPENGGQCGESSGLLVEKDCPE